MFIKSTNTDTTTTTTNLYKMVKDQISFAITGRQSIICPQCKQPATATTSGVYKAGQNKQRARDVKTSCRHCHTSITFVWK